MSRTNIEIDESLIRKARKLTQLKTKRQIVDRALDLLVRSESRKAFFATTEVESGRATLRLRGEIALDSGGQLCLG